MPKNPAKQKFFDIILKAGGEVGILEDYQENPCRVLSIPYWKHKRIAIPGNMRIVHHSQFVATDHPGYRDERYFRLRHALENIPSGTPEGIRVVTACRTDIGHLADIINQSYDDLSVTCEQLLGYTRTEVYHPALWVMAVSKTDSSIVGCGIADFDREMREGILEWIQVLPSYRGRGIGQAVVNALLQRLAGVADFATVSGKVDNRTSPETLYRKCGFTGNDVWHILTK